MQGKPKARFVAGLSFFEFIQSSANHFRRAWAIPPISQKSVAQILVDGAFMSLDDFLAGRDPTSKHDRELVARYAATQLREILNISHQQPARQVCNFADGSFGKRGSVIIANRFRLMENVYLIADHDLVVIAEPGRLLKAATV